jgi:predicted alternative tryptophan synthase beta-subunit
VDPVLTSKLLARRWRVCNPSLPQQFSEARDEEAWRERTLELLSNAHTIGGISELSFEKVTSDYSVSFFIPPVGLSLS